MPARLALGCTSLERKALLRALPATVPGAGLSRSAVLARLRRFNNPAGGEVYGATGCTAFPAEGSFAGLSRKCAWSGCSSAIHGESIEPSATLSYNYLILFSLAHRPLLSLFLPTSTLVLP